MTINEINIAGFGKLKSKKYTFDNGLNLIYGLNESGKTTLINFIKFIFYGTKIKKKPNDLNFKDKYLPWESGIMSGSLHITDDSGKKYIISRTVSEIKNSVSVIDAVTGEDVRMGEFQTSVGKYFFGLSEDSFSEIAFLSNLSSVVHSDKDGEILNNLSQSGDKDFSYTNAIKTLNEEMLNLSSPRRKNSLIPALQNELYILENKIIELRTQVDKINVLRQQICDLTQKKDTLTAQITDTKNTFKVCDDNALETRILSELSLLRNSEYLYLKNVEDYETNEVNNTASVNKIFFLLFAVVTLVFMVFSTINAKLFLPFSCVSLLISLLSFYFYQKHIIKVKEILTKYKCGTIEDFKHRIRIFEDIKVKIKVLEDELYQIRSKSNRSFIDEDCKIATKHFTFSNINDKIQLLYNKIDLTNKDIAITEDELKKSEAAAAELESLLQDKSILEVKLSNAHRKFKALKTSQEILEEAFNQLKHEFSPQLANKISQIISKITDGKYNSIFTDESFSVKFKTDTHCNNALCYSRGTYEQIYLAMRFALLELAAGNKILPAFLDDAFAFYDDNRFINVMNYILEESAKRQIFVCTCHSKEYMFFRNKNVNIIEMNSERND